MMMSDDHKMPYFWVYLQFWTLNSNQIIVLSTEKKSKSRIQFKLKQ
jgi:hypothetical protein